MGGVYGGRVRAEISAKIKKEIYEIVLTNYRIRYILGQQRMVGEYEKCCRVLPCVYGRADG